MRLWGRDTQYRVPFNVVRASLRAAVAFSTVALCLSARANTSSEEELSILSEPEQSEFVSIGTEMLGDQLDLFSGGLSIRQVDISIPGNFDLPVQLSRSYQPGLYPQGTINRFLGDWQLEVPLITGTVGTTQGWHEERCTDFTYPQDAVGDGPTKFGIQVFDSDDVWHGWWLQIPGHGSRELVPADPGRAWPTGTVAATSDFWSAQCLSSIANGTGEGFVVTDTDGTQYTFNQLAYEDTEYLSGSTTGQYLKRSHAILYATKVEDRFGNWVKYNYSGDQLQSITSSDGRQISLTYEDALISTATVTDAASGTARVWSYEYESGDLGSYLISVSLPNNQKWLFELQDISNANASRSVDADSCDAYTSSTAQYSGAITAPNGLKSEYTIAQGAQGLGNVNEISEYDLNQNDGTQIWKTRCRMMTLQLVRKKLSGPGLVEQIWAVTYSNTDGWWSDESITHSTKYVDITAPDSTRVRHTLSMLWDWTEGQRTYSALYPSGSQSAIRTATYSYHQSVKVGDTMQTFVNQ